MNFKKINSFENFQVSDARNIVGGDRTSRSVGGAHKGQTDTVSSSGKVTYQNGDTGQVQ